MHAALPTDKIVLVVVEEAFTFRSCPCVDMQPDVRLLINVPVVRFLLFDSTYLAGVDYRLGHRISLRYPAYPVKKIARVYSPETISSSRIRREPFKLLHHAQATELTGLPSISMRSSLFAAPMPRGISCSN